MKLNNKGYLIVEVILAGVLTFTMAYFLINLTLKIRNRYDDGNAETVMLNDKTVITNEIMSDVIDNKIISVDDITNGIKISFEDGSSKDLTIVGNTINYGSYTKKLSDNAIVGDINIKRNGNYFLLEIPITTKYSDKDFGINIFGFTKDTAVSLACNLIVDGSKIMASFDGNMVYHGWDDTYTGSNSDDMNISVGTYTYYIKDSFGNTGSCSVDIQNTTKTTGDCYSEATRCSGFIYDSYSACWNSIHDRPEGTQGGCEYNGKKYRGCLYRTVCPTYISCPAGYTKVNDSYCYKK